MLELEPGDQVDIYRTPKVKDAVGWRGPATVISTINIPNGFVDVQWGGRAMSVRIPDVRKALSYLTSLDEGNSAIEVLRQFALTVVDKVVTFAYIINPAGEWQPSKAAQAHPDILRAGIHVGYNSFGIRGSGVRIGHGQAVLNGISGAGTITVLMWYLATDPQGYRTLQVRGHERLNLRVLFGENWLNYKFMQFLSCSKENSKKLHELDPEDPYLGQDPDPDNQHPQSPQQPDEDMSEPDADMPQPDEDMYDDDIMHDPPTYPKGPPPMPNRQPVSTGSTRREPVSTTSSQHTLPGAPPGPPPPKAPFPGRVWRTPMSTGRSMTPSPMSTDFPPPPKAPPDGRRGQETTSTQRSRTPFPSHTSRHRNEPTPIPIHTAGAKSSSTARSSMGWPGSSNTAPSTIPYSPPSTIPYSPQSSQAQAETMAQEPNLPFADSASDAESEASTVLAPEYLQKRPIPPRITPSFGKIQISSGDAMEETAHAQQMFSSETKCFGNGPWANHVSNSNTDGVEIEFSADMAKWIEDAPPVNEGEVLVIYITSKNKQKVMVEKVYDALTAADVRKYWPLVEEAIRKECAAFQSMGTYELQLREGAKNVCSSRWVHRFKIIDGVRSVKSRLTIRGFEDLSAGSENYAGTATRWSQRVIISVAIQKSWRIFITDVSTAFLRSMTFEQMAKEKGTQPREVSFVPPVGSETYFRELKGMSNYDPVKHVLRLLKPVYGLKDAPAAWKKQLNRVLSLAGGRQLLTDKCLWAWFSGTGTLVLLLSTHVDDLKGTGEPETTEKVLKFLEKEFGTLKTQYDNFTHCGIAHETDEETGHIIMHQHEYAKQLILMDTAPLISVDPSTPLNTLQHSQYLSLLGGASWMVQTRLDICVYICALQRAAKSPQAQHALRLVKVCKWIKRKSSQLLYKKLRTPTRISVASDAAFRKEDVKGLAMRGAVIMITEHDDSQPGGNCHILEWYARKQRRVTRSTFSAELNAASDAYEFAKLIAMTVAECVKPYPSIKTLVELEETGGFPVPINLTVDARSVFDALRAAEIKAPSEISLIMFLCQLKEAMLCHALSKLWWCDTHDMVADGLNKGAVSRQALLDLVNHGRWTLTKPAIGYTESRYIPIASQKTLVADPTDLS
jgi:hypothetical protein